MYTFSPSLSFLTVSGTTLTLATDNASDVGSYEVEMTVWLVKHPTVTSLVLRFSILVEQKGSDLPYF